MKRRLIAAAVAMALAFPLVVAMARGNDALAICAIYRPDDPEWYLFFCYLDK